MLLFLYRRRMFYPAFKLQLERGFGCTELVPGLMLAPQAIARETLDRLAGIRGAFELLVRADSPDDLLAKVEALDMWSEPFLIEHSRLGHHPQRLPSKRLAGRLALRIGGGISFDNPSVRFRFFETPTGYFLARHVYTARPVVSKFKQRPVFSSAALHTELAAAAINAVAKPGDRLVDPTCGSGTILYEAALRAIDAWGYDIHWTWVNASRENLKHFNIATPPGVTHHVMMGDARDVNFEADVVVANLPYGRKVRTTDERTYAILKNLRNRAQRFAFFGGVPLRDTLTTLGYRDVAEVDLSGKPPRMRFMAVARR